jgi:hypothetical protein
VKSKWREEYNFSEEEEVKKNTNNRIVQVIERRN